jgi:hypothetical protein
LTSFITRIKTNLPDQNLIQFLIEQCPPETKNVVWTLLSDLVRSGDPARFVSAIKLLQSKPELFDKDGLDTISLACIEGAKKMSASHADTFLRPILDQVPKCSVVVANSLTDVIVEWLKSEDPSIRSKGVEYYRLIRGQLGKDRIQQISGQLVVKLQSMADRLDQCESVILLLLEDQQSLEDHYRNQLLDLLGAQLSTARSEQVQLLGIRSIVIVNDLGKKSDQILTALFSLAKTGSPKVRDASKGALDSLKKYKGPKGFWEDFSKLK